MELFGALCVLYLLHCIVWLPEGACLFVPTVFGPVIAPGPGFRILHPRPSARSLVARRFPVPDGDLSALRGAEARKTAIFVERRALARCADPTRAEELAAKLREIGGCEPDAAQERIENAVAQTLSPAALGAARARFDAEARVLAWTSDAYWLSLFAVMPAAAFSVGSQYALAVLGPAVAVLHVATLWSFARAHARLFPTRRAERVESAIGAAFYPPSVLRAYHHLRDSALGAFHPAAVAVDALPAERGRAYVRAALVRATAACGGSRASGAEERGLRRLVAEIGESPATLLAVPARRDPRALGYCPACLCEYRRDAGDCSDCGVPLARLGSQTQTH